MLIDYDVWKNSLLSFSNEINGLLEFKKNPSIGYGADFITGVISCEYSEFKNKIFMSQNVISGNNEAGLSFLIFEDQFENKNKLHLGISQRDFFDKIFFVKPIKTGNNLFNKKFSVNSSDKAVALNIFSDSKVQDIFLGNSLLVFNILTKAGIKEVKMKHMGKKLYSCVEMQKALDDFRYILSKMFKT